MCQSNDNKRDAHTYDEAVELTGHGRYNYMLLIACCVITMGVGMDMFGFAIIVSVSKCDLKLGLTETGVLASAPLAGVLFAYPWGYYADTRGRRRALLLSTFVGFVFAAVCSFSPSWQLMMFFKLVSCSFSTASFTLTMTMLGECTGCAHRNQYLFILNSINLLSDCFSFGLAYFLLPLQLNYHMPYLDMRYRPWRLLTLVLALPLGIGGLMMLYLHESPKFLASRGDNKKSLDVLRSIYTWNGGDEEKFPVQILLTTDAVQDSRLMMFASSETPTKICSHISLWESLKKQTIPIFKPPLLWRTIQLTYLLIVCISTNNGFTMWFPTIVNIFFTKLSGSWNTDKTFCDRVFNDDYVTNFTNMEYNINFTGICVDTLSEYTVFSGMFSGFLYCMLSLVVIKVAFYRRMVLIFWLTVAGVSCTLVDLYQPAVSLVFLVLLQTSTVGLPSLASYFVDLYPTSCRGMVGSLSMMVTRICSIGAVNLVGAAITTNCSLTFYGWAGFAFSHGRYNYMLLIGCCVITMGVGMDMFGFAIIVTVSKCDLKLGLTETGVLASAPLAGVLFAYPWGYYADTRGRRRALLLSTFVGFVFAAVCSFSPSWQLMMFFKLVSCSFSTASYTLTMTMLGECTGCAHRNQYLFILNSINLLSDCFSFGLAYFLLPLQLNYHMPYLDMTYRPWRLLTLVLALPLGIGGLMMLYLHESPKFLASRGDNKKSLDVLRSIYTWNGGDEQKFPVQILLTTDAVEDENMSLWESLKKQTIPIFKPPLLWRTIQLTYLMIVCICTNNGFAMWFPTIVNIFFTKLSGSWNTDKTFCDRVFNDDYVTNFTNMEYNINFTGICVDTLSEYTVFSGMFSGFLYCMLSLVVIKVAFYRRMVLIFWLTVAGVSCTLVDLYQPAVSLVFLVLLQTSTVGLPSLASYFVDLYPTSCRGMVGSLSMMVTRICSIGAVNLVGAAITTNCSLTFYGWAGFAFSGVAVAYFLPRDKKMEVTKL